MARTKGSIEKKFTDKEIQEIHKLAAYGLSLHQIGGFFSLSKSTMDRRIADDPRIAEAVEKGRSAGLAAVTQSAYRQAISGKNTAMTIFYLKTRGQGQWREKQVIEHQGLDGGPIQFQDLSEKEMDDRLSKVLKRLKGALVASKPIGEGEGTS